MPTYAPVQFSQTSSVYGPYHYTSLVDPNIGGVSLAVFPAWGPISYASYYLTNFLLPTETAKAKTVSYVKRLVPYLILSLVGGIFTTAWDMMMDPVDVARGWYIWHGGGVYMSDGPNGGVPISNYLGWIFTGFSCCLIYRLIFDSAPKLVHSLYLDVYGPLMLYAANFSLAFGFCLVFLKRADVLLIGFMSMGVILAVSLAKLYLLRDYDHSRTHAWIKETVKDVSI